MRLPRIFGKKRGHRRTGSQIWGTVGDAAFHAALLLAGVIFGGLLVSGVAVPEWRINHDYLPARCTVVGKRIERRVADRPPGAWHAALLLRYETDGTAREAWAWPGAGAGAISPPPIWPIRGCGSAPMAATPATRPMPLPSCGAPMPFNWLRPIQNQNRLMIMPIPAVMNTTL